MLKKVISWSSLLIINQVHKLSGTILLCLDNLNKIDWTRRKKKKRPTIASLIMKVVATMFSWLYLPKCGLHFLCFVTKTIHTLSGNALKSIQQNNQTKNDQTNSQRTSRHPNLDFYLNRIPFQPSGEYIDEILLKWYGNYHLLLSHQWYIQWLFPNKEDSSDVYSFTLTDYEAHQIKNTPEAKRRVLIAFQMMLNFWGMELTSNNQFRDSPICHARWKVLNSNPFLGAYITRILKMFKDLDLHHLNSSWLTYLSDLIFRQKELSNLKSSFVDQWLNILPDREREILITECALL